MFAANVSWVHWRQPLDGDCRALLIKTEMPAGAHRIPPIAAHFCARLDVSSVLLISPKEATAPAPPVPQAGRRFCCHPSVDAEEDRGIGRTTCRDQPGASRCE